MPTLGMTMEEGTVVAWPSSIGAPVEKGTIILVIESEKNEVEIEAPTTGFLRHVYVEEGETVPCGTLLGGITETADEVFDAEAFHSEENRPEAPGGGALEVRATVAAAGTLYPRHRVQGNPSRQPRALPQRSSGSIPRPCPERGRTGRVTKQDVEAHVGGEGSTRPGRRRCLSRGAGDRRGGIRSCSFQGWEPTSQHSHA